MFAYSLFNDCFPFCSQVSVHRSCNEPKKRLSFYLRARVNRLFLFSTPHESKNAPIVCEAVDMERSHRDVYSEIFVVVKHATLHAVNLFGQFIVDCFWASLT